MTIGLSLNTFKGQQRATQDILGLHSSPALPFLGSWEIATLKHSYGVSCNKRDRDVAAYMDCDYPGTGEST